MPPRECKVCTSSARGLIRVSGRRVRAGFLAPSLRLTSSLFINQSEDLWQREEREGAENRLLFTIRFLVATSLWCWHVLHRQYEEMMLLMMKAVRSTLEGEWCGQMGAAAECSYWWQQWCCSVITPRCNECLAILKQTPNFSTEVASMRQRFQQLILFNGEVMSLDKFADAHNPLTEKWASEKTTKLKKIQIKHLRRKLHNNLKNNFSEK